MKKYLSFFVAITVGFANAQEIADKEAFKKCRKEFSKKICLSDGDKDDVLFYLDRCPQDAGEIENNGCIWPDTDGDGVKDKDDACPSVTGPPENNGCPWPDTDGDGILDKDDMCPTVAGTAITSGCPEFYTHRYTEEELNNIEKDFINNNRNVNYHLLADFILKKIRRKNIEGKIIFLTVMQETQVACGLDRQDYAADNLIDELTYTYFWDHKNLQKFVKYFSDKVLIPLPSQFVKENRDFEKRIADLPKTEFSGKIALKSKESLAKILSVKIESEEDIKKISSSLNIKIVIKNNIVRVQILPEFDFYFLEYKNAKYSEIVK